MTTNRKLQDELKECTFSPRISRSPVASTHHTVPGSPRGYDDNILRMRAANQEKLELKKNQNELGKPKLTAQHFTA